MPVTAQEAAEALRTEKQAGSQRLGYHMHLPPTLARVRRLMREENVFICNVGPWPRLIESATLKSFFVPAYDPKQDTEKLRYVKSAPIPGIFRHAYIANEDSFGYYEDDGKQIALEAIGIGFGLHPMNSIVREGFFVPERDEPTSQERGAARAALSDYIDSLIEEARDAYDKGPEERKAVIGDRHLLAARLRGIDERWVHHQHTQESVRCSMCGKYNPAGVAKCQCGSILDVELYRKLMKQQKQMLDLAEMDDLTRPVKK